nr:HTH domain-containing protein [Clostridium hydrogenum]
MSQGIKLEELQSFMKDTNSISYEKKYKLATSSLFLHYLLKKTP